jgi:hypothetical protein
LLRPTPHSFFDRLLHLSALLDLVAHNRHRRIDRLPIELRKVIAKH